MYKSPFLVQQEFLSPMLCEQIVDNLDFNVPDQNQDGHPIKTFKTQKQSEEIIFQHIQKLISDIENHYKLDYRGTTPMTFEWYADGCKGDATRCENGEYIQRKWVRTRDRDITGIIFLCDHQDQLPFDGDFEVYGGKVEFPQHQFGFNPQRGTLILFPSGPHFLNGITEILAGDSYLVRFHIAATKPYLYDPKHFRGDFLSWFEEIV